MSKDILSELNREHFRKTFLKYTRKAFQMLPALDKPSILDIGCGEGLPTIELAQLSDGEIIGIDIDQSTLDELNRRIEEKGLSTRIRTKKCSSLKMEFPDESFDIIWAEGSIAPIGFKKGLMEWKRFLKPNGFMVIHDDAQDTSNKIKIISNVGYRLINHFLLPKDAWMEEYFVPLQKRIQELCNKYKNDPKALKVLEQQQNEVNAATKQQKNLLSVFFIMQKL